jgi:hypothetical protein
VSFLRPAARETLRRWSEVAAAGCFALLGVWAFTAGGYFFIPLGSLLAAFGVLWALVAFRRLRFLRPVDAPGVVEVMEGQISYLGPVFGGTLALSDLSEVRLIMVANRPHWRIRTHQGEALLIPADAAGAERLHDAFATLPGIDMAALSRALGQGGSTWPLWTRPHTSLADRS